MITTKQHHDDTQAHTDPVREKLSTLDDLDLKELSLTPGRIGTLAFITLSLRNIARKETHQFCLK